MAAFTDLLAKASRPAFGLDANANAGRQLAGGAARWLDPTALAQPEKMPACLEALR